MRIFASVARANMTLTSMNLGNNRLGNAECAAIVAAAAQMQTLKSLHLDDNLIHALGCKW